MPTKIEIENRIEKIIASMTLKEKIGQLNQISFDDIHNKGIEKKIEKGEIGSFILYLGAFAGEGGQKAVSVERLNQLQEIAVTKSPSKIPLIFGKDVIHGHYTVFPIPLAIATSFNPELVEESYSSIAEEATSSGINWTFTPMIDMARDPRWGRIVEGCGEDSYLASVIAKAMIGGLQGDDYSKPNKMAACAKHYIGYGASEGGRDYHKAEISDYSLRNLYLPAFKAAVDSGVATVMSSFNEISGEPVTSSEYLINGLLKDELGFNGFVVSDYGAIEQLEFQGVAENREECTKLAINAGIDMDMSSRCYSEYLEKLVNSGQVKISTVNEAVRRVLRVKAKCGLFDNPYTEANKLDRDKHKLQAKELATESLVLLKNIDAILPLNKSKKYVLAGPMAKDKLNQLGTWALDGDPYDIVSIEEGLKTVMDKDCIINAESDMINDILLSAIDYDTVIVVCGESKKVTGEFKSLASIEIPKEQTELLKSLKAVGKKVIAVMCFGRPVAMDEAEKYCDAILFAWHGGTMSGAAIADVLVGNASPSGKLPVTFPRCTGQIPIYYNVPSSGRPVNGYYEELRNYLDVKSTPMYPFGYGLSYTEFELSNLNVIKTRIDINDLLNGEKFKVSIRVKNIGEYGAKTVMQCYINDRVSEMTRPLRELKAFKKVYIDKNDEITVEFELGANELGYYNRNGVFVVEKGVFDIYVGQDCYAKDMCSVEVM